MLSITELLLRLVCAFFALLILTRIMGRKEMRQLTFFNFISGIAIGSIAANLIASDTFSLLNGMTALVVWSALTILFGLVDLHSRKARHLMEGNPILLIHQGEIMEDGLRRVRLDVEALKGMLRQKNAFAVSEVAFAVLETDGSLSVMKKKDAERAAGPTKFPILPTEIISDGRWNAANMDKLDLSREEVLRDMKNAGLQQVSDVFYAEVEQDGSLYFSRKQ
ncbi:Uncharacterized membrane protein YcaP, DUF421 family [Salibacterium halotolerans]|uniref:Uncharacterized membrane protein YcaP, DUF421 family n=1 Tax=Salibacterium halotolerans TaxID=1884432 RepID=A0A1I5SB05_9BACI|nr:Uncharacterized membrane protein YcaP, DUF421 family [Salibacterium halotolerans]